MTAEPLLRSLLAAIVLLASQPMLAAETAGGPERPGHVVPAWYQGMPVVLFGYQVLPPDQSSPEVAANWPGDKMTVYIAGAVRPEIGVSPGRMIPFPAGPKYLPGHQGILPRLNAPDRRALGVGYFVELGPAGDASTVQTDPLSDNAWPSAPLATAIRIGPAWVPLDNHAVIEFGVATGLLQLEFFNVGDEMWATLDWDDYRYREQWERFGADAAAGGL